MDNKQAMDQILQQGNRLALATCANGANVRIVNYIYEPQQALLYFATFAENIKVQEMQHNPNVAITTIPDEGTAHVRATGQVQASAHSLRELDPQFIARIPGYQQTIEQVGDMLAVYEIALSQARIIADLTQDELAWQR